ncbi:MAG: hypothetical protein QXR53_01945 [Candidatus Norongarragalinales archaeon]
MEFREVRIKCCSDSRMVVGRGSVLKQLLCGLNAVGVPISGRAEISLGHNAGNEPHPLPGGPYKFGLQVNLSHLEPDCGATGVTHHEGEILETLENELGLTRGNIKDYIHSHYWKWDDVFRDVAENPEERAKKHAGKLSGNPFVSGQVHLADGKVRIIAASKGLENVVGESFVVEGQKFPPKKRKELLEGQKPHALVLHPVDSLVHSKLSEEHGKEFPVEIDFDNAGNVRNERAIASIAYWLYNAIKQKQNRVDLKIRVITNGYKTQFEKLFGNDVFFKRLREKISVEFE